MPQTFVLDVLFYSLLLWLALYIIQVVRGHTVRAAATAATPVRDGELPLKLIAIALPLTALLAAFLWLIYVYAAYAIFRIA